MTASCAVLFWGVVAYGCGGPVLEWYSSGCDWLNCLRRCARKGVMGMLGAAQTWKGAALHPRRGACPFRNPFLVLLRL